MLKEQETLDQFAHTLSAAVFQYVMQRENAAWLYLRDVVGLSPQQIADAYGQGVESVRLRFRKINKAKQNGDRKESQC